MTKQKPTVPMHAARDEKLRAIAHVFGDAVAARLRSAAPTESPKTTDASQLAWQTNRLIRHLRERTAFGGAQQAPTSRNADTKIATTESGAETAKKFSLEPAAVASRKTARIPALVAGEDLAGEHPAVIAHVLRTEPQHVRVSVLRALPGNVSRAVMRRLRTV